MDNELLKQLQELRERSRLERDFNPARLSRAFSTLNSAVLSGKRTSPALPSRSAIRPVCASFSCLCRATRCSAKSSRLTYASRASERRFSAFRTMLLRSNAIYANSAMQAGPAAPLHQLWCSGYAWQPATDELEGAACAIGLCR